MADRPILLDTTRLLTRLKHPSPSGIDRVDLAYARYFLTGAPDRAAVGLTYFGARILPAPALGRLLTTIEERWKERVSAADDPVLRDVRAWLAHPVAAPAARLSQPPAKPRPVRISPLEQAMKAGALRWRRAAEAPRDAVYLHTSHLRLDRPQLFEWLGGRPDIRPVFFVHDLIPIDFPEYGVPGEAARHRVRMATIARHAAAVITNSVAVADRFRRFLKDTSLPVPPVTVAPLGVEPAFAQASGPAPPGRPYFVICSTIEARKNHLLLLQLWREMSWRLGLETPALVIVGRRGWESEAAIDLLDRCEAIRQHVIEASELSTAGLAALVAGAQALLMPSFAEGYGIPIVEALTAGTPVIASDIAVHREVAGPHGTFRHSLDGPGWEQAITAALERTPGSAAPTFFRPPTWDAHFDVVDGVLAGL